jgi:hypothetical protein
MTTNISNSISEDDLWLLFTVGAFAATAIVYSKVGFIQSFLPLLFAIYGFRQYLQHNIEDEKQDANDNQKLIEKYDIEPDREYSSEEQIEILATMRSEYNKKRILWAILVAPSLLVGRLFISVSAVLAFISVVVAGYCLIRLYRTHNIVSLIDDRVRRLKDT